MQSINSIFIWHSLARMSTNLLFQSNLMKSDDNSASFGPFVTKSFAHACFEFLAQMLMPANLYLSMASRMADYAKQEQNHAVGGTGWWSWSSVMAVPSSSESSFLQDCQGRFHLALLVLCWRLIGSWCMGGLGKAIEFACGYRVWPHEFRNLDSWQTLAPHSLSHCLSQL